LAVYDVEPIDVEIYLSRGLSYGWKCTEGVEKERREYVEVSAIPRSDGFDL
jgi:hypothetical protein